MRYDAGLLVYVVPLAALAVALLPRALRRYAILGGGLALCAWAGWVTLAMLVIQGSGAYVAAGCIARASTTRARRWRLAVALAGLFSVLALGRRMPGWEAPLGLSFYSLQAAGVLIDIARRRSEPERNPLVFAAFMAFFPILPAGPIERAQGLLAQLREPVKGAADSRAGDPFTTYVPVARPMATAREDARPPRDNSRRWVSLASWRASVLASRRERWCERFARLSTRILLANVGVAASPSSVSALQLILWGLFKKVVLADRLAAYVNRVYGDPTAYSGGTLLMATYFFAFQLYADFSGYTDIARGAARLMGFEVAANFRRPYFACSLRDFWHRWHMSLSGWFRDYLYIPLGGSRHGTLRWILAILLAFSASGLWHGFHATFALWGLYLGVAYLAERGLAAGLKRAGTPPAFVRGLLTFHVVLAGWVLFRAASPSDALLIFRRILGAAGAGVHLGASQVTFAVSLAAIVLLLGVEGMMARAEARGAPPRAWRFAPLRWLLWALLIIGILIFGVSPHAFVYAQF